MYERGTTERNAYKRIMHALGSVVGLHMFLHMWVSSHSDVNIIMDLNLRHTYVSWYMRDKA